MKLHDQIVLELLNVTAIVMLVYIAKRIFFSIYLFFFVLPNKIVFT